jgi:hypothetical protein
MHRFFSLLFLLVALCSAPAAQQVINRGTVAGDHTGEQLFTAFGKVNDNFTELYGRPGITAIGSGLTLAGGTLTIGDLSSIYQPLNGGLTSLANAAGTNTLYYRSAANTWSAVTIGANLSFAAGSLSVTLTAPGPIGSVTPNTGAFTTLSSSSSASLNDVRLGSTSSRTIDTVSGNPLIIGQTLDVTGAGTIRLGAAQDVVMLREAANVWALRNGTNAQGLRVQNTWSNSGTDFERGEAAWSGNVWTIQTISGGTGSARGLTLQTNGAATLTLGTAATARMTITGTGSLTLERTNTAGGTTGAQTIHKMAGSVNFAAAATSLVVTNSLVSATSNVFAVVQTNDSTAIIKNVVPGSGSFTINLNAAATAETRVAFWVTN